MTRPETVGYTTRDNGGVRRAYSINWTGLAGPFGRVLASVTRPAGPRYRRGDLVQLVVTVRRRGWTRRGGVRSAGVYNGGIPLKKDGSPVGSRVYGAVYLEARHAGYTRLAAVAAGTV